MRRRIRLTLVILSLVLCVASLTLWVRSYRTSDTIITPRPAYGMGLGSVHGRIRVDLKWSDRASTVVKSEWRTSGTFDPFAYDTDPLGVDRWNWSTLLQGDPAFRWEWIQAAPPDGSRTGDDGMTLIAGPPGARPTMGDQYLRIHFPHWVLVCILGLPPAVSALTFAMTHWRRYRRLLAGHCPLCGYDLCASPGRCPECGWKFDAPDEAGKNLPQAPVAERQTLRT